MKAASEVGVLNLARALGWVNFFIFAAAFVTLKSPSHIHLAVFWFALALCVIGSSVYYVFYNRIFVSVPKSKALKFFVPYRLGAIIFVLGITVTYILVWFGR